MTTGGVPSTMLTGQECIADDDSRIASFDDEMADFSEEYDIAVIDEAQLTADPDRGHCWTKAILGLKAHEIHVCMSPAAESAVTHLIHLCGDSLAICRYQRKTALICEDTPFSFPESVLPGDALVVFSKKSVLDGGVSGRRRYQGKCYIRKPAAGDPPTPDAAFYQRQNQGGRRHRRDRHGTQPACPAYRIRPDPEI